MQRWFQWLGDRGGIEGHPLAAVLASCVAAVSARPVEAERWADAVDRWQYHDTPRADDPVAEAWAAVMRYTLCRHGVEQMRADADEAADRFAAVGPMPPTVPTGQGIARVLCGDLDDGDAFLEDAIRIGGEVAAPDILVRALCQRYLLAVERDQWSQAEAFADQARSVLRRAGIEKNALLCAVQARSALHRGDAAAARQELVSVQELRPSLTYAVPHLAIQVRIELIRVYLALADLAGARTLMREVDELLRRRPGMGILVGQAEALRAQLSRQRGGTSPGPSALTAAELRVLPLLATHLTAADMATELFVSVHTVKSQQASLYRKLGTSSRSQAVTRARQLGLLEG